jgi:hypothetical protein
LTRTPNFTWAEWAGFNAAAGTMFNRKVEALDTKTLLRPGT